ncbi:hypothetical protein FRC03_007806 [Tulasnella sp. 419]|nr:hypothetical protein FRC03_007806 [Tulasnella sp. 419]
MFVKLLLRATFVILLAGAVDGLQVRNVTYYADNPALLYTPSCDSNNRAECRGAWWTEHDPKYGNGLVRVAGDPDEKYGKMEAFVELTFRGTGFYVYQWINKTSSIQTCYFQQKDYVFDFQLGTNWPYPLNDEATLMPTWIKTGLDPGTHVIMIAHNRMVDQERFTVIDRIVVEELVEDFEAPESSSNSDRERIIGASVASVALVLAITGLLYCYKRKQAARARKKAQADLITRRNAQFTGIFVDRHSNGSRYADAAREDLQTRQLESSITEPRPLPNSQAMV